MRRVAAIFVVVFVSISGWTTARAQAPTAPATTVGTVAATMQPVTRALNFVGRIAAVNRVDITARVTGYLEEVRFQEGQLVVKGAPLYRLEQGLFNAEVVQAKGALLQAQGVFANAAVQRQRAEELVKTAATSVAVRDQRIADEKEAQGGVIRADANLQTANINLGYTEITSPIAGRIGRTSVTAGNVVSPGSGVLTTIVSVDPMYVLFPVSQREFLKVQQSGQARANTDKLVIRLQFADGTMYEHPGAINFIDVTVDQSTDTVTVRGTVPNPNGMLVDGQFARVAVQGDKPEEKLVVPQSALLSDQAGIYVFIVEDGKAVVRRLTVGGQIGTATVVEQGLKAGDLVVMTGLQSLRPGAAVVSAPMPPTSPSLPGG